MLLVHAIAGCSPGAPERSTNGESQAAAAEAVPAADMKLIVAFGDSLFAGYRLGAKEGLAPVLEADLNAAGLKAQVVNAGVSGDTSAAGRARLAFTLDGLERKPDLVIVGFGGNDMLRGLDPKATEANLRAILDELKARGIPAMLSGLKAAPNMGGDYVQAFDPLYPALAKDYGVPLYPFTLEGVIGNRSLLLPDGIHPNPAGVAVIARGMAPLVREALAD